MILRGRVERPVVGGCFAMCNFHHLPSLGFMSVPWVYFLLQRSYRAGSSLQSIGTPGNKKRKVPNRIPFNSNRFWEFLFCIDVSENLDCVVHMLCRSYIIWSAIRRYACAFPSRNLLRPQRVLAFETTKLVMFSCRLYSTAQLS